MQEIWPHLIGMAICLVLSAFFSASETAFSSLNKTRLKTMVEDNQKAALALHLAEQYDRLISTILIGNNIVNISIASIGTVLFVKVVGDMGATVSTVVVTVAVLIFGEITPKSIAKDCPERFAMFAAPVLRLLIWVMAPLNFLFSLWKKLIAKIFKIKTDTKMSQEELLMFVEEVEQGGTIDSDEMNLLRNAIEFNDQNVVDILTHRVDLEGIPIDADKLQIAKVFDETRYTRLLVYEETIDNIIGILHLKDFYTGGGMTQQEIRDIMSPPLFIHKTEKLDDLLRLLQSHKSQMAIILDEYGGTLGIVTMEDVLEELVGEIWDEHDEVEEDFRQTGEHTYLVDCGVNMDDFCDFFDIEVEAHSVSVGGWISETLDKVPVLGDQFDFADLQITVTKTDGHRIAEAQVIRTAAAEA